MKSLAESAALTLRTLLGDPCPLLNPLESPSARYLVIIEFIRRFYVCHFIITLTQYTRDDFKRHLRSSPVLEMLSVSRFSYERRSDARCLIQVTTKLPNVNVDEIVKKNNRCRGKEEKLEIYETRDCYPVQSNETIQMIEEKLNALIESKVIQLKEYYQNT